jgi:hypothetical protein
LALLLVLLAGAEDVSARRWQASQSYKNSALAPFSWRSRCNCSIRAEGSHIGLIGSAPNCLLVLCIDQPEGSGRYPRGVLGFMSIVDLEIGGQTDGMSQLNLNLRVVTVKLEHIRIYTANLYMPYCGFRLRQYSLVSTTSKTT